MKRIQRRFEELSIARDEIAESVSFGSRQVRGELQRDGGFSTDTVRTCKIDANKLNQWTSSVEALLLQVFGKEFPHYVNFKKQHRGNSHDLFNYMASIFNAAKDDYQNGYIFDLRSLVHAKVFANELEQASELLKLGYKDPAAVVAGIVLETTLKELCEQNSIETNSLNRMNADLAKEGVYNDARKDQVQAWSKVRNNAAHGHSEEFNESEVSNMINGVRDFVATQLS